MKKKYEDAMQEIREIILNMDKKQLQKVKSKIKELEKETARKGE